MKKLLKILFLLVVANRLVAQDNKNQVQVSKDSIEAIHGMKVGVLKPVLSDGLYQRDTSNRWEYNRVLDTKTGVLASDTISASSIIYELIDTVNVVATKNYVDIISQQTEPLTIAKHYNSDLIGHNIAGMRRVGETSMVSGGMKGSACWIAKTDTIREIVLHKWNAPSYTGDATKYNGVAVYSFPSSRNPQLLGYSTNSATFWDATYGTISAEMATEIPVTTGIYFVVAFFNATAVTTAPNITYTGHTHRDMYFLGNDFVPQFSKDFVVTTTMPPAELVLSEYKRVSLQPIFSLKK